MRRRSITARLTLAFAIASTSVLLLVGVLVGRLVEGHFEQQDLALLEGELESLRHVLAKVEQPGALETVPDRIADALVGHDDLQAAVLGPDRRLLYTSPGARFPPALLGESAPGQGAGRPGPARWNEAGQAFIGIAGAAPTGIAGGQPARVAIAANIEHRREFMTMFLRSLWPALVTGIALTVLLGWIAARRGLAPVREMIRVTQGISASRLDERLDPESVPTELRELAVAFNQMLARLADSFRRLSDFSSDLAHELRTPVSNLMTETQVALSRSRGADEYREVLYSNLEEYERLARMTSDMLFLAKADNGLITTGREPVRLRTEVEGLFGFYEALCEEQGIGLRVEGDALVHADRAMLRRAIGNVLSNAIRHTPAGASISVGIRAPAPATAELVIENPGEAIDPRHLPRLFDRFYRAEASRQPAGEGAGLGLAIAKSIVEAHGGSISVVSREGVTRFGIVLPHISE